MKYAMNKLERWMLKKIAKRISIQSAMHDFNIQEYFEIMIEAAKNEFTEDNIKTREEFLTEIFNKALSSCKEKEIKQQEISAKQKELSELMRGLK